MIARLGEREPLFEGKRNFVAHDATIIGTVKIKSDASIWFNAVLRGDCDWIEVGERSNIQDGSVLHTDPGIPLVIGDGVTIGHKVMLHGCQIGAGSLIGIGSTILNGAVIGKNCLVGAHALITEGKSFPDGVLIVGSPAKIVRDLRDEEIAMLRVSAEHYVENGHRFLNELQAIEI